MNKRDSSRKLRSPFVVTVAAAASVALASVASGCGAVVMPTMCDGGACSDVRSPSQCPPAPPRQLSDCSPNGLSCTYTINPNNDSCGLRPFQFFCNDGRWRGGISTCNPPPPMCPPTPPMNGAACDGSQGGMLCNYTITTPCGPTPIQASCVSGRWSAPAVSCNPPPPDAGSGVAEAGVSDAGSIVGDGG